MKYILCVLSFLVIFSLADDVFAKTKPKFPPQIEDAKLIKKEIYYQPKSCLSGMHGEVCSDYWVAKYEAGETYIYVYLINISSGLDIKKTQTVISEKYLPEHEAYINEENALLWFNQDKTKLSKFSFNQVQISQAKLVNSGGGLNYDYVSTSPISTDVAAYFLENFPATKIVQNQNLINQINAPVKGVDINFIYPVLGEKYVAGKNATIIWGSQNILPEASIYFQLMYTDVATGQTKTMGIGTARNKEGKFEWKIPKYLGYGDENTFDNYIYKIEARLLDFNGRTAYKKESQSFRIINSGNKKSKIVFTDFKEGAEINKGENMTIKWIGNPHTDRYELNLISKKSRKDLGSVYDSVSTQTFLEQFSWKPFDSLNSGSYYFLIKGYLNGKVTSESKSPTFIIK